MSDRVVSVKSHPFCEHGRGACNIIGSLQDVVHIAITFSSCVWDPLGIWYHGGLHSRSFDSVSFSFQVSFTPPNTHNKNKYRKKTRTKRGKKLSESRAPSHHSPLPWLRPFSLAFLGTAALASKWKLSCCVHICCTSKLRPCSTCGAPHRRGKTRAQRGGKGHIIARVVHTMTCGNVLIQCLGEVGVFGSVGHE